MDPLFSDVTEYLSFVLHEKDNFTLFVLIFFITFNTIYILIPIIKMMDMLLNEHKKIMSFCLFLVERKILALTVGQTQSKNHF